MKIAIASSGKTSESMVDLRFGRCPYFLIGNSETDEFETVENTAGQTSRGAGVSAAQMIANKGVKAVIAGNFGPNAVNVLKSSGIKIYGGVSNISVKEAYKNYEEGKLKQVKNLDETSKDRGLGEYGGGRGWQMR